MALSRDEDDDGPPSPISPILPSSPPRLPQIRTEIIRHRDEDDLSDDAVSGIDPAFDYDEDDEEFGEEEIANGSNMSLPADQRKHLADVDSSFRGSTPMVYSSNYRSEGDPDRDLSIVGGLRPNSNLGTRADSAQGRRGDMGPPVLPASAYRRSNSRQERPSSRTLRHSTSNISNLTVQGYKPQSRSPSPKPDPHDETENSLMREKRLEDFSSPSVAAQTRNISRAASSAYHAPTVVTVNSTATSEAGDLHEGEHHVLLRDEGTTRRRLLRSRRGSARSSISSIGSAQVSDIEDGVVKHRKKRSSKDHDLPTEDMLDNGVDHESLKTDDRYRGFSRNPSFGSMASTMTVGNAADRALARLDEEERNQLKTPRPTVHSSEREEDYPPQTAMNRQISNIQVPETVARDFRRQQSLRGSNGSSSSPSKRPPGTASKNMSLKEQSGIIDKLQKENFDLKVKISFLDAKMAKSSEEGVADVTRENVDLRIKIVELGKVNKALRRRIKALEKSNGELEANSVRAEGSEDEQNGRGNVETVLEEEVTFYKERTERLETELETIRTREVEREAEYRQLKNVVQGMTGGGDEVESWRDLYISEANSRKKVEAENAKYRDEIWQLRSEAALGPKAFSHSQSTTNNASSRSRSSLSQNSFDNPVLQQLRTENEDLRREIGAQTSMLTSRNREKEVLYQQIEELKLGFMHNSNTERALLRPSDSISRDGTVDRSVSRISGQTALSETERDTYENVNGQLRDANSELKLRLQELEIELETRMRDLDSVVLQRQDINDIAMGYEEELELLNADLMAVQVERNDHVKVKEELEMDFDALKEEAEEEIQRLEEELEFRQTELERMADELRVKEENFNSLQNEMRGVSDMVVGLEDTGKARVNKISQLETEIEKARTTINEAESEMTALEKKLVEVTEKSERLGVQVESAQGEIAFLREEQDGDKIKIGQLEGALKAAEEAVKDEKERVRSLGERLVEERKLREETRDIKKQEFEGLLNEKNQEILNNKESMRQLKKSLSRREAEVKEWKDRLTDLETGLREALGDLSGTRTGILKSVVNLQLELEQRMEELETVKNSMAGGARTLKDRENLMESMALETRKLQDVLEKERLARKQEKAFAENLQNTTAQSRRTIAQHQSQLAELEKARNKDSKALMQLETQYREQLAERNSLLVTLWQRLSVICGTEWLSKNQLTGKGGVGPQSADAVVSTSFGSFAKSMVGTVKVIEGIVGGFKNRVRNVERDLWKEYQVVENTLETRTRRLERLESMVRDGVSEQGLIRTEVAKLRTENRLLKAELNVSRLQPSRLSPKPVSREPSPHPIEQLAIPIPNLATTSTVLSRAHSTTAIPSSALNTTSFASAAKNLDDVTDESERRWILRLRELEKRLKAEREARLIDRNGAKQRLEEARTESTELKRELEREKAVSRAEMIISGRNSARGIHDDDDASIRTTIVRVEKERRNKDRERERGQSRDPEKRDRGKSRDPKEREVETTVVGRSKSASRVGGVDPKEKMERLRDRDRDKSSSKSSSNSTRSSVRKEASKRALEEANMISRKDDSKSPPGTLTNAKKEGSLSPRKLLGFLGRASSRVE